MVIFAAGNLIVFTNLVMKLFLPTIARMPDRETFNPGGLKRISGIITDRHNATNRQKR